MAAYDRPFARFAAGLYGPAGPERLKAGECPSCGTKPTSFRDKLSEKEFAISGLCQACQDKVFNADA